MSFPVSKNSLFAQVKRKQSGYGWDMLNMPQPLAFKHNPEKHLLATEPVKNVDSNGQKLFNDSSVDTDTYDQKQTEIEYKSVATSGSFTVLGGGIIHLDFKILSADGKYISNFKGHVKSINFGIGGDLSGVVSTGTLYGPKISWHKNAVLKSLNNKAVTGKAFTFAIFNGLTIGAEFKIGEYIDPAYSFEVDGVSIGWEGFRGTLVIDQDSFKITKNETKN